MSNPEIAAFIAERAPEPRYQLVAVPGAELGENQCSGFGCVDGCSDCRGCPECFISHDIQNCPAVRALLFREEVIANR